MNNINIFRANRGEGKTKWLIERAIDEYENGKTLYYVGSPATYVSVKNLWEATMHSVCPIAPQEYIPKKVHEDCVFFTDELLLNVNSYIWLSNMLSFSNYTNLPWYITMDKEDFVN